MHPCNRGEKLTRSVQENAANRTLATRTRAQVCERPELFIDPRPCDNGWVCASNFLGRVRSPEAAVVEKMLISGFRPWRDSRLECHTMIGTGRFRRRAGADLFCPFCVLVIGVLV